MRDKLALAAVYAGSLFLAAVHTSLRPHGGVWFGYGTFLLLVVLAVRHGRMGLRLACVAGLVAASFADFTLRRPYGELHLARAAVPVYAGFTAAAMLVVLVRRGAPNYELVTVIETVSWEDTYSSTKNPTAIS